MLNHGIVQQNERSALNAHEKNVLSKISDNILTKGIEIIDLIKDEAFVLADKNMVEAGIRNVISNAKKFTNKGGNINVALQCVKTGAGKYCHL